MPLRSSCLGTGGDECMLAGSGEYRDESSCSSVSAFLSPGSSAAPSEPGIVASDESSGAMDMVACEVGWGGRGEVR